MVNDALASLDGEFAPLHADFARPTIAPERLIRASLIQILFSVRSERQSMEQMQYNCRFTGSSVLASMTRFGSQRCSPDNLTMDDGYGKE